MTDDHARPPVSGPQSPESSARGEDGLRQAVSEMVTALDDLLTDLVSAMDRESPLAAVIGDCGMSWLRPLAILNVDVEYAALRRTTVDTHGLTCACEELRALLLAEADAAFAKRYAAIHASSPRVAADHERVARALRRLTPMLCRSPVATDRGRPGSRDSDHAGRNDGET
jgi:hypothetical protein